jgi:hypothetical protein
MTKAFEEGKEARLAGKPFSDNPYIFDWEAWRVLDWDQGWEWTDSMMKNAKMCWFIDMVEG